MKHHRILMIACALPLAAFAKEKKDLDLDKIPAKAAEAIRAAAGNEKVTIKAEKEEGTEAFEAKWSAGGHQQEITVTAEGVVISREEVIPLESAPAPVQAAVREIAKDNPLVAIEKVTEKEGVIYEAGFKSAEGKLEVKFDADGKEKDRKIEKKGKEKEDDEGDEDGDED